MQTILDYLTAARSRGQGLRGRAEDAVQSFLSSALPPQTVGQLNLLNEVLNPVAAFEAAGQSAQRVANPDLSGRERAMAGLETAATVGAAALPGVGARMARGATDDIARALQETVIGSSMVSDRPARFMADESGALRVYRGGDTDPRAAANERGAWFSETEDLAAQYGFGRGGVSTAEIDPQNPARFVHAEQRRPIGDLISTAVNDAGDLSPEQIAAARPLVDRLQTRYGDQPRALFEYWNNDPDVAALLRSLGYDSISVAEKSGGPQTWGVLNPNVIREPLSPPRNSSERAADEAARLMREGDLEQAESLMQFADDRRLFQLYERGEVGANLPMDQASRMDRARDMGNVEPEYVGSLEPNIRAFDPRMARGERRYGGSFSSDSPAVASSYADPNRGTVYPLVTRGMPDDAVRYDAQGAHWNRLSGSDNVQIGDRTAGPMSTIVDSPGMRGMYDTNQVSRLAFYDGRSGTEFANVIDRGPFYPQVANDPSIAQAFQRAGAEPSTVRARQDTRGMRSRFARFDPRFADSRNIMAGVGGLSLLDYALGREQPEY